MNQTAAKIVFGIFAALIRNTDGQIQKDSLTNKRTKGEKKKRTQRETNSDSQTGRGEIGNEINYRQKQG